MDDLISRQQAIDALHNAYKSCPTFDIIDLHNLAIQTLRGLPSAEPQIIRCKDCDNFDPDDYDCFTFGCKMRPDGFCSFATERGGQ